MQEHLNDGNSVSRYKTHSVQLCIAPSQNGYGLGVFADEDIKSDTLVTWYFGSYSGTRTLSLSQTHTCWVVGGYLDGLQYSNRLHEAFNDRLTYRNKFLSFGPPSRLNRTNNYQEQSSYLGVMINSSITAGGSPNKDANIRKIVNCGKNADKVTRISQVDASDYFGSAYKNKEFATIPMYSICDIRKGSELYWEYPYRE